MYKGNEIEKTEKEESEGKLGGRESHLAGLLYQPNNTFDRFSLFVCEEDFRLFKMDSSGCQGNSVTIVTAMETFSVA